MIIISFSNKNKVIQVERQTDQDSDGDLFLWLLERYQYCYWAKFEGGRLDGKTWILVYPDDYVSGIHDWFDNGSYVVELVDRNIVYFLWKESYDEQSYS